MAPQGGSTLSKMPEGIIMLSQPPGIRGMSAKTSSGQTILELAMAKMRVVQVPRPKGPLELVERDIPEPQQGTVRVRVQTCGICHSDTVTKDGLLPGIEYPRVPGHEVIGIVDAVGPDVSGWTGGERVGIGWHGGYCGYCGNCRRGYSFACETETLVTGVTSDGGYADYMISPAEALARVPDELSSVDAAPLMCAGITTFNALRNSGVRPGEAAAILGLGGLGHLGVQYAAKLGFKTIAIDRGQDKAALVHQLGAQHYIDSATGPGCSTHQAGRCESRPGDGNERGRHECRPRWPRGQWDDVGDR